MDVVETGSGPVTIVAVHGIQGTRASWSPLVEAMTGEAKFILPNLRGRAEAARGRGREDYRLECFADDLEQVIAEHVGGQPFYLAGWSMGVSVSLACLSRADAPRPKGLILMSGTPMLDQAHWFNSTGPALIEEIAEREERLRLVAPADREAVAWTWEAISTTNQMNLLGRIDMPVLIVHGRDDADSPWDHAVALAEGLPDACLCPLAGIGHSVLKDATSSVAEQLRAFITRTESSMRKQ